MKFSVNSWPAAAVIIAAIIGASAVIGILGWHNPEATLAALGGLATTTAAGLLPSALRGRAPSASPESP